MNTIFKHLKTAVLVVFIAFSAFVNSPVSGDLEPVLQRCCLSGESWARNHTTCTGPSDMTNLQATDRLTCLTTLYICCIRAHRKTYCENGKNAAKLGRQCVHLPEEGAETYKDCCDGCSLGLQAEKMRMPCSFSRFTFGHPWDEAFRECCEDPFSALGTSPQVTVNSQCDVNNPCNQKCEVIANQIRCSCYPGYQLAQDLTTCDDVNECLLGTHSCNPSSETCVNAIGGFQCVANPNLPPRRGSCPPGYTYNQDKRTCDDIDECLQPICPRGQRCLNSIGSYRCLTVNSTATGQCPNGFTFSPDSGRCIDVDECRKREDDCDREREICQNSYGGYQCIEKPRKNRNCPAGFKWDENKDNCEDVDECREDTHNCLPSSENCVNSIGSYRCVPIVQCPHGFRWRPDRSKCDDVDECSEGSHDCDPRSQTCINTVGSYQCQSRPQQRVVTNCGTGYTYNSVSDTCEDLNECDIFNPCGSDQQCENTFGSYKCFCQQGYTLDAITKQCKDVNECQLELHSCATSQRCDNTIGSFTCVRVTSCGTGYTLNAATNQCEDDDECVLGNHNCGVGFICRNTAGSFRCDRSKCPAGQKLLSDGTCKVVICGNGMEHDDDGNCIDINECIRGHSCRAFQRCINTVGSYRCQNLINCEAGYELNEQGDQCVDIDECARGLAECDQQQTCRNRPGGYVCECPRGYSLNTQRVCEDVDECTRFRGQICASHSECINTQGSYKCNCNEGFRAANDDKTCVDVDECSESPNICQQTCNNVWGSYQCSCKLGYTLAPDERSCIDINECEVYGGIGNLCIGFCVNEPGSFKCSCPNGYRLSTDGRTCQDIDECREENVCNDDKAVCLNTRGGYKCNRIDCPPNYVQDKDHRNRCKRVVRDCQTGGPDCLKEPLSYSYNYITFVSNMRLPLSGQVDLFTMRGPRFQSTTVQFALELKNARAPQGTTPATKDYFHLRRTAYNEAMISLTKTIPGPQEIELDLVMKMYHNGLYGGTAIAKLFIFVTEYNF